MNCIIGQWQGHEGVTWLLEVGRGPLAFSSSHSTFLWQFQHSSKMKCPISFSKTLEIRFALFGRRSMFSCFCFCPGKLDPSNHVFFFRETFSTVKWHDFENIMSLKTTKSLSPWPGITWEPKLAKRRFWMEFWDARLSPNPRSSVGKSAKFWKSPHSDSGPKILCPRLHKNASISAPCSNCPLFEQKRKSFLQAPLINNLCTMYTHMNKIHGKMRLF